MVCYYNGNTVHNAGGDLKMDFLSISIKILTVVLGAIVFAFIGIIVGLFYKGIDRKISAHMQGRIGPPIRQPFRDVVKLFTKENW